MQSTDERQLSASERNKEFLNLIIIIVALIVILGSFILYLSWPLMTGSAMVLATQPVDPFDPLRGQYMTIRYEINVVPKPINASTGDTIYVSLKEDAEGIARHAGTSLRQPSKGMFIKGEIKQIYGDETRIEYGIEQYFFERNAQFETQNIQVEVKVSSGGQARITRLLKDGKPLKITYQNKSLLS